jgi:hypothetical protein
MREDGVTIAYNGSMFKVYILGKIESNYFDGLSSVVEFLKNIEGPTLLLIKPDYENIDAKDEEILEGVRLKILEHLVRV